MANEFHDARLTKGIRRREVDLAGLLTVQFCTIIKSTHQ